MKVEGLRVHPYYRQLTGIGPLSPDDVAILKLTEPLTFGTAAVGPIILVPAGPSPAEGTPVNLTGFGEQNPSTKELNGNLYSLGMSLGSSEVCGGEADALLLCASAPGGSACSGDSGSGLTTGPTPTLVGVIDVVQVVSGESCQAAALNGFANLAAPEIRGFIEGSGEPPRAPRGGGDIKVRAIPVVGHVVTCEPGTWSNNPTFTFSFIDSTAGQILQSGASPTYPLSAGDVGRTIYCQVQASNAGGTGTVRTGALRPVRAAPAPPPPSTLPRESSTSTSGVSLLSTAITVQSGRVALVKLRCVGAQACSGKLTLSAKGTFKTKGKRKTSRTVTIGTASFSVAGEKTATVKLNLNATGRALLSAGHGRLSARLAILELAPGSTRTQAKNVRLVFQRKAAKSRRHRK